MRLSTHSARLERWLGKEQTQHLSERMRGWYGPPIAIANVPGTIYACGDGDFVGGIRGGYYSTLFDLQLERMQKAWRRSARRRELCYGTGFASLSDLINEFTAQGKGQVFPFAKVGTTGVANVANSLWDVGVQPAAGSAAAGTTAGSSPDNTTVGGFAQANPSGGDTLHFINAIAVPTQGVNMLLLYDRYYAVNHNIATQSPSVTGVPTRYQDTTSKGNFITVLVTTVLGGTVGNYQLTYMDQDGNTAEAATTQALVSASIVRRFPFAATVGNGWYYPLNSPDNGVRKITQITQSAATGTGNVDVVLAKPYVWIPQGVANFPIIIDGINSAFNLVKITDSSCLAFMEINKGATTATAYTGSITLCAG